ncbi:hypothetical protein GCM10020219_021260 [Nonomuraea dietziae]
MAIGLPWEMTRARPLAMPSMARVAMKGGSLPYAMRAALASPHTTPTASAITVASGHGRPEVVDR